MNQDVPRSVALAMWREKGKSDQNFRWSYKRLKDHLLNGILPSSFKDYSKSEQLRADCWTKYGKVRSLLVVGKKDSFLELAAELFKASERCGLTEIAHSLARDLHYHFSLIDVDDRRRERYGRAVKQYCKQLREEEYVQGLFIEFGHLAKKKKDTTCLEEEIEALRNINSSSDIFNLYKYSILIKYSAGKNDHVSVVRTCLRAIDYFKKSRLELPYTTSWNFYRQLIPYLISEKKFGLAESKIHECMKLPREGSLHWHFTLIQLAFLGFRSVKPKIVLRALHTAEKAWLDNAYIVEQWEIVKAYLVLFELMGEVKTERKFRIGKFMNSVDTSQVNVVVFELLYLFLKGKFEHFCSCAEKVGGHLKKADPRTRNFMRLLQWVGANNCYRYCDDRKASRYLKLMQQTKEVSQELPDELIPFEVLWGVMGERMR
jgi:hypothetical protein